MRQAGHKPGRHANFKEEDNMNAYEEKWSPSRKAWVRQATGNGIFAAGQVKKQLAEMEGYGDK